MCHHKPVDEWEGDDTETAQQEDETEPEQSRDSVVRTPIAAARRLVAAVTP